MSQKSTQPAASALAGNGDNSVPSQGSWSAADQGSVGTADHHGNAVFDHRRPRQQSDVPTSIVSLGSKSGELGNITRGNEGTPANNAQPDDGTIHTSRQTSPNKLGAEKMGYRGGPKISCEDRHTTTGSTQSENSASDELMWAASPGRTPAPFRPSLPTANGADTTSRVSAEHAPDEHDQQKKGVDAPGRTRLAIPLTNKSTVSRGSGDCGRLRQGYADFARDSRGTETQETVLTEAGHLKPGPSAYRPTAENPLHRHIEELIRVPQLMSDAPPDYRLIAILCRISELEQQQRDYVRI